MKVKPKRKAHELFKKFKYVSPGESPNTLMNDKTAKTAALIHINELKLILQDALVSKKEIDLWMKYYDEVMFNLYLL